MHSAKVGMSQYLEPPPSPLEDLQTGFYLDLYGKLEHLFLLLQRLILPGGNRDPTLALRVHIDALVLPHNPCLMDKIPRHQ